MQHYQQHEDKDKAFPVGTFSICIILCCIFWGLLIGKCTAQNSPTERDWYGWTKEDLPRLGAFGLCVLGGIAWGTHEAIYADPRVLEKRFGFAERSWGGSRSWESKYPGGDYQDGERPVWIKDKTNLFREAKKTTAFAGRYLPMTAGIIITANKKRKWTDYVIGAVIYSASATATYNLLR